VQQVTVGNHPDERAGGGAAIGVVAFPAAFDVFERLVGQIVLGVVLGERSEQRASLRNDALTTSSATVSSRIKLPCQAPSGLLASDPLAPAQPFSHEQSPQRVSEPQEMIA
jgi:hypothetical protein